MAERSDPPRDFSAEPVKARDESSDADAFLAELKGSQEFQVLGLAGDPRKGAQAVVCTLAQRLSDGEMARLIRTLPPGLGLMLRVCGRHEGTARSRRMGREEFIGDVADHLGIPSDQAYRVVTAVFTAIRDRIPDEEVAAVASELPADLADLFRRPV